MNTFRTILSIVVVGCAVTIHAQDKPSITIVEFPQEVAVAYTKFESNDVLSIHLLEDEGVAAVTPKGNNILHATPPRSVRLTIRDDFIGLVPAAEYKAAPGDVRQAASHNGIITVASSEGLFENTGDGFKPVIVDDGMGRRWGTHDVRGVTVDTDGYRWFVTLAGVARDTADGWKFYTGADGLPYNDFTCAEAGPDGSVWFGTTKGAIRFKDGEWAYRQGRRWLPNDHVRDIAIEENGNVWFATAGGVGKIEVRMMTLAEKAEHFEKDMDLIRRTPFGYVAEIGLSVPGDKTSEVRHHDSDNDGLWTAMYGAGEAFAYGATKDPKAKERAKKAFEALRFLQKVTQGSEHAPPHGYVARTILPTSGHDPNIGRIERDRKNRDERESMWKVYEPRWPKSADGKWYFKTDTSSDELDGHYFFYPIYYDLVAETEEEKERVREVVRDLTDHLIKYGYNLIDHDGEVTRWGVYGPDELNHDGYWWYERGLKSLSMLSYLAVAEHMTGDKKYREHFDILVKDHAFDTNAIHYKIHSGFGSGNQSDDEMAFMSYYNLVNYVKDPEVKKKIMMSFYMAWTNEQPEMNPFFNFCYAAFGIGEAFEDPWGAHDLTPWKGWLEDSVATLKGFPLDRYNWASQNSHRLDIVPMSRQNAIDVTDSLATSRARGYRVNGKVIPVENRYFNHWNTDPWRLDYGGAGNGFGNGTVFLLPYYMGLYHGFIEE
jgi:hypothetical protein